MGALLQQRGMIVLHGNAISTDGKSATIFVGDSGAGKSTTAGYYFKKGATILADDVCAIYFDTSGVPHVVPSYPQIKLWEDTLGLLNIPKNGLRQLASDYNKFGLPLMYQFSKRAMPVSKIIEIYPEDNSVTGGSKVDLLIKHSYRGYFLPQMQLDKAYMRLLLKLASNAEIVKNQRVSLDTIRTIKLEINCTNASK